MLHFSLEIVRLASELTRIIQSELVMPALNKADKSPVTVADLAVQAFIAARLEAYDPDIPLVGEESAAVFENEAGQQTLAVVTEYVRKLLPAAEKADICRWIDRGQKNGRGAERFWTLDPVDGTKGFLRREQYAVALAFLENGRVEMGVLGCPQLSLDAETSVGVLAYARRNEGAWMLPLKADNEVSPTRLHVSGISDISQARVLRSVESGHTNVSRMDILMERLGVQAPPVLMDSQAKYVVLAAGRGEMLFRLLSEKQPDYRECIWDQAAGSILVEEAGGKITDLNGKPLDFTHGRKLEENRGICATNGVLHAEAVKALAEI